MPTDAQWRDLWNDFFKSIADLLEAKANSLPQSNLKTFIERSPNAVINPLILSPFDWQPVQDAINSFKDPHRTFIEQALFDELEALVQDNAQLIRQGAQPPQLDKALKDAQTGKESLEDLLPDLPKWIKKLLTILNEVLKLARGS